MINENTFRFLKNLRNHNDREWFHAHKAEYDTARQNVITTVGDVLTEINTFDPIGYFDVRKAMFRIARDTRFSTDKLPYKSNFGIYLTPDGTTRSELAGYYIHIEPGHCFLSSGLYMPEPGLLKAVRRIIDEEFESFRKILHARAFKQTFGDLGRDDDALSRVPVGFDKNSPAAEYLKLKRFYVSVGMKDADMASPSFVKHAARHFKLMKPFNDFLNCIVKENNF